MSACAKGWIACAVAAIGLLGFLLWPTVADTGGAMPYQASAELRLRQLKLQFENFSTRGARIHYPENLDELRAFAIEHDADAGRLFEQTTNPVIYRQPSAFDADEIIFFYRDPISAGAPDMTPHNDAKEPKYVVCYAMSGVKRLPEMPPVTEAARLPK